MKRFALALVLVALMLGLAACKHGDEWMKYYPLPLETEGLELEEYDRFQLNGIAPADGADFTAQGIDKYADISYVTWVTVNDVHQKDNMKNGEYGYDWGTITYDTSKTPVVIKFHIAPNDTGAPRYFWFSVGPVTRQKVISIDQLPLAKEE